jgi:hypothetical protein
MVSVEVLHGRDLLVLEHSLRPPQSCNIGRNAYFGTHFRTGRPCGSRASTVRSRGESMRLIPILCDLTRLFAVTSGAQVRAPAVDGTTGGS